MEQEQNESPGVSFDPINTGDFRLIACPFLGLEKDPHTLIAFPHRSNRCHKLRASSKIDLAHQSAHCLSGRFESCDLYQQPGGALPPQESRPQHTEPALPAVALPSPDELPSPRPRLESLKLRLLSYRLSLLLFRLRLRARMPAVFNLPEDIAALGKKMPLTFPSLSGEASADKLSGHALKKADLRLFAIPAMILLILLAAIIWWPPPGERETDAIVVGAPIAREPTGSNEDSLQPVAPATQEEIRLPGNVTSGSELLLPELQPVGEINTPDGGEQDDMADSPEVAALDTEHSLPSAGNILSTGPSAIESEIEPAPQQEEIEMVQSVNQVAEEEPGVETQIEAESADIAEDAPAPAEAPLETIGPDILPVGAVAFIGPASGIVNPEEIYESQNPLFLHALPADDSDIVARISSKQPAAILGRDSSGEWILVRLNGNFEGWANTVLSGIDIPTAALPDVTASVVVSGEQQTSAANPLPAAITGIVNIGALNVRAGPGIEYESIGVVYNKDEVSLLAQPESNNWVQVRLANGLLGWLNSSYLILPG